MIKQIINESEWVQTKLRVEVDGITITYNRMPYDFGYTFRASVPKENEELGKKAILEVVSAMESQSYDHGASWRRTATEFHYRDYDLIGNIWFRVRDAG